MCFFVVIAVDCGPLVSPENGLVILEGNQTNLGSRATYRCNIGYELAGLPGGARLCTLTGLWSGMDPTCDRESLGGREGGWTEGGRKKRGIRESSQG